MNIEKERLTKKSFLPSWVNREHTARYSFASKFVDGKVIIDCACGAGIGSKKFIDAGAELVYAFDSSREAITEAKDLSQSEKIKFGNADALKLPLADSLADIYISLETIEHIDDDKAFLEESSRVLKPGGIFICSTPNRLMTNPGISIADKPCNKFHIREYSAEEFEEMLARYFSKVEFYGQNYNAPLKTNLLNMLGKILPFHGATRIHQVFKLLCSFFRKDSYYNLRKINPGENFEYITAFCRKS